MVFYSLPEYPHFYPELVNMLNESEGGQSAAPGSGEETNESRLHGRSGGGGGCSCLVLFTRFEQMALERIVGQQRSAHMLSSSKNSFLFK